MQPVPWSYINSWNCIACGLCCKEYEVILRFPEWLRIVKNYGVEVTIPDLNKFYLKKRSDGSCVFLHRIGNLWICALQNMKPQACKLWPFKVYPHPKYGRPRDATYRYAGSRFFVYVDPACVGIRWGRPSHKYLDKVIPEFIQIATGSLEKQRYSTANIRALRLSVKPGKVLYLKGALFSR